MRFLGLKFDAEGNFILEQAKDYEENRLSLLPYREGDWFGVPLTKGGYAIGLVARANGKGIIFGYFFNVIKMEEPTGEDIAELTLQDTVALEMFGDLGLLNDRWLVIASSKNWDRSEWPMPKFARIDYYDNEALLVSYDENTLDIVEETPTDINHAQCFPKDRLNGYQAIEMILSQLLQPEQ